MDERQETLYGHTHSKSMDQPSMVANPARGQLSRENEYFPVRVRLECFDSNTAIKCTTVWMYRDHI